MLARRRGPGPLLIREEAPQQEAPTYSCILEPTIGGANPRGGLFLAGADAQVLPLFRTPRTLIINLQAEAPPPNVQLGPDRQPTYGFTNRTNSQHPFTYYYPTADSSDFNLIPAIYTLIPIIEEHLARGMNVLVHCFLGVCRSSSVVIAFLMAKHRFSFARAFAHVKERRSIINPNLGFVLLLESLEIRLNYFFSPPTQIPLPESPRPGLRAPSPNIFAW